jgi:dephospho-CoA kinase
MKSSVRRTAPLVIGVTGGIGCGKSHVRETLVELGADGIDADLIAHAVMTPGGPAYEPLIAAFGHEVLLPGGAVDRAKLGALVFTEPSALAKLEALVHPAVLQVIKARVAGSTAPAVAIEAIKLLEAGLGVSLCDQVWVVNCSEKEQLERLALNREMSATEVRRRQANQMPYAQMLQAADRVIHTDGTLVETERRVLRAWLELGLPLPAARVAGSRRDHLLIAVRMDAPEARAFYQRLGFIECGRLTEEIAGRYVDQLMVEFPL